MQQKGKGSMVRCTGWGTVKGADSRGGVTWKGVDKGELSGERQTGKKTRERQERRKQGGEWKNWETEGGKCHKAQVCSCCLEGEGTSCGEGELLRGIQAEGERRTHKFIQHTHIHKHTSRRGWDCLKACRHRECTHRGYCVSGGQIERPLQGNVSLMYHCFSSSLPTPSSAAFPPIICAPTLLGPLFHGRVLKLLCAVTVYQFEPHLCRYHRGPASGESAGCARGSWPRWAGQLGWRRMCWREDSELCAGNEHWADAWNLEEEQTDRCQKQWTCWMHVQCFSIRPGTTA